MAGVPWHSSILPSQNANHNPVPRCYVCICCAVSPGQCLPSNSILADAQARCLDEVATRRPSQEAVGAGLEMGLEVIASKYTERCPRVFGFDVCGPLADLAIGRIASSVTEWMTTTRGILGDYYGCHRACRMAGGRKGSPGEPDSCKGACEALHGRDNLQRARNFVQACLELANLHPAVRAVYDRAANWCKPAGIMRKD